MRDHDRLQRLLRSTFPPVAASGPSRDLWPSIVRPEQAPQHISWVDIGLGAIVAIGLLIFPDWLWLLAYHL